MMAVNGIKMHMEEIEACFLSIDDEEIEAWRSGHRHHWPAPDGRGFAMESHPIAATGPIGWIEAWEIARPWFVDPDAKPFMMNAVHPEHWFQGEYDLVYRWGGQIKIVDIKASLGNSDRSGDYVEQLRMYAYLWWSTHEGEHVDALEIWYLAADSKKIIQVPNEDELNAIGVELKSLWSELREETPDIERCPAEPAPMRSFGPGGIPSEEEPSKTRCERCDWSHICPKGEWDDVHPNGGSFHLPGLVTETEGTPLNEIKTRHTVTGRVHAVIMAANSGSQFQKAILHLQMCRSKQQNSKMEAQQSLIISRKANWCKSRMHFSKSITKGRLHSKSTRSHAFFESKMVMKKSLSIPLVHDGM